MRRTKPLPTEIVNGWQIEKCPNTFAEQFAYTATAVTPDGYQAAKQGFRTKRDAVAFATKTPTPIGL
jgi:hypothetical protein